MVNPTGIYIYCIIQQNDEEKRKFESEFGNIGLNNQSLYTIRHNDISAVVSKLPLAQLKAKIDDIMTHQKVIETIRQKLGTTILPVRFGTVVRNEEAVKNLLLKSYKEYKLKLDQFEGKDEFGIKVLKTKIFGEKIKNQVETQSQQIQTLKHNLTSLPQNKPGSEYMLNLTLKDTIKKEILKKMEQLTLQIHDEFLEVSEDATLLGNDNIEQLALNSAYLVKKDNSEEFRSRLNKVKEKYEKMGLIFHMSGPWTPYSFC
jgi:hypothetical protein